MVELKILKINLKKQKNNVVSLSGKSSPHLQILAPEEFLKIFSFRSSVRINAQQSEESGMFSWKRWIQHHYLGV